MNLFHNPSLKEFRNLINECDSTSELHNIVVDYDGEVLIDPQLQVPEIDLNKFKFRMRLYKPAKVYLRQKTHQLQNIFINLMLGWENDSKGFMNVAIN